MNQLYFLLSILFFISCGRSSTNHNIDEHPVRYQTSLNAVSDILLPSGYERMALDKNSFGYWLRHRKIKKDKRVYLYNGSLKPDQSAQYAVLDIPIGNKNLQQCADAILRLRAEYFLSQDQLNKIIFKATDGTVLSFSDWRKGTRYKLAGKRLALYKVKTASIDLRKDLELFLEVVFTYCGTYSLQNETTPVNMNAMRPGDVLLKAGAPGHAMLIMDVATNSKGNKIFMLAQSYMPAQDIHIVTNPVDGKLSPWYYVEGSGRIVTPEWEFNYGQLNSW